MQALVSRQNAAVLALLFAAGCATKPPTQKEEVSVWLSESPRAIAIKVEPQLPSPSIGTRDHQGGKRVAKGAAAGAGGALYGAGVSVYGGCAVGGPIGCAVGIALAPIGAVVGAVAGGVAGAVAVESVDVNHPVEAAQGSSALFELSAEGMDLAALLSEAIVSQGPKAGGHALRSVHGEEEVKTRSSDEALLQVRFSTLQLFGDVGEDPRVALVLGANADLQAPPATAYSWTAFTYKGPRRPVSEWKADDARLFREEIAVALRAMAAQIAEDLASRPSGSAVSKVAAARANAIRYSAPTAQVVIPAPAAPVETPATLVADQPASKYPVLGDRWVYQYTDLWRPAGKTRITHEILAVKDSEILEALTSDAGVQRFTGRTVSSSISDIREWALAGISIHEFAPYALAYDQLKFGATSGATRGIRWPGDSSREWTVEVTSQSEELVEVPAGRFRAVKVFIAGSRPPSPTARMQRFEMTVWYAQESKRYVKLAFNSFAIAGSTQHQGAGPYDRSLYELVSFTAR
jgi:hypothetical protein